MEQRIPKGEAQRGIWMAVICGTLLGAALVFLAMAYARGI